jgi:hypothetical protein
LLVLHTLLVLILAFSLIATVSSTLIDPSALVLPSVLVLAPSTLIVLISIQHLQDIQSSHDLLTGNTPHLRSQSVQHLSLLYVLISSFVLALLQVGLSLFLGFAVADIQFSALELLVWCLFFGCSGSISFHEADEGLSCSCNNLDALDLAPLREVTGQVLLSRHGVEALHVEIQELYGLLEVVGLFLKFG